MSGGARWDGWARVYDAAVAPLERWPVRAWRERVRACLRRALAAAAGDGPVLEVGAGTGRNRLGSALGRPVVAVDLSRDMLLRARERGYRLAVVADAGALPFPDGAFAAGAETLTWCEVERPVEALSEVGRVLAGDGVFVMLDHVRPPGILGPLADALSRLTGPSVGEWWNRDTRRYAGPAGFRVAGSRDDLGGAVRTLRLEKLPAEEAEPTTEGRR